MDDKIYHYCPICDRSLKIHENDIMMNTLEKVLIHHFNTKHESLCRKPTEQELKKFSRGSKRRQKRSIRTISGGGVSPK
ncbi:MAG: hypothetical protein Q4B79_08640 [Moraxella sp.]|uniref:hypothetical protein n=1 Tax=Moraxella sp. TaxID=479 RepID=UPI0026DCDFC3|nr:hypothetical protein [Moraxella sp.]MDO4451009.1 hypothetical protein [Moraxella sp.]